MLQWLNTHLWKPDWSKTWGTAKIAVGGAVAGLGSLGDVLHNSEVKDAISQLHLDPRIGLGLAVLGAVTLVAASHE